MSKILVLAEKPSVGREMARVLKANKKDNGYMEGDKYVVTWALGHLVELAPPENYNKSFKEWKMEDLPIIPKDTKLQTIGQTTKQFKTVSHLMNRKDISEIVIATDAGREGELVARWIIEKSNVKKPMKRLWISSVTDKAIREGFQKLKPAKDYENLYKSAQARAEADWVVGINATRALTLKYNAQLSCGRVQTPTLSIVNKREEDIKSFIKTPFYNVELKAKNITFTYQDNNQFRIHNKEKAEEALKRAKGNIEIVDIKSTDKKTYPPSLYDLTTLQADCNKIYGFSGKETLNLMQNLYERHKVLTYPRTDSRHLTEDIVSTIPERLQSMAIGQYKDLAKEILKKKITPNKNFVDDSKVSDHHAIIPTEEPLKIIALSEKEKKVYDLVAKRFLAVLMPPMEYKQTTITGKIENDKYIAKGKIITNLGFKKVDFEVEDLEEEDIKDQSLPNINIGEKLPIENSKINTGYTSPPSYFTEGTLLKAMENPSAYVESKLKKVLKETGGIGTVATRGDIIDKLFKTFLLEKSGNNVMITSKGKQLLELVPEKMKSPELTGEWELKLDQISKGKLDSKVFLDEIKKFCRENTNEIKTSEKTYRHDNITRSKCPECGKYLLEVKGRNSKMLVCQDRECGFRKTLSVLSNARCPNCHKKMELIGEGENKSFYCSCGHREKLSKFNERKKKQGNKMSKKEVNNYLKKQKEENLNNSLMDQLKGLKLD